MRDALATTESKAFRKEGSYMLWTIAVILLVLWVYEGWCDRKKVAGIPAHDANR